MARRYGNPKNRVPPQFRYLAEGGQVALIALGSLVLAWFVNELPCSIMKGVSPKLVCEPTMLWMFWIPFALFVLAFAVGGWRYYKDYHCGELWDDL
ncbi:MULTISPECIES: hypothetical protein [Ralstonia]|nr:MULTISPECIES: hypothetical protein [Ralstonia]MBL4778936.1 hypothetical protein [Ralstonia sp.]MCM3579579.1 hypothetical protein [Ralstonia pickettii]MDR9386265.1 hypothetical protein [Ralstonia sp. 11b]